MTYEEFLEQVQSKAQTELSYSPDMIEYFPEGYTSRDPKELEWVIESNRRYGDVEAPHLLTDILLLKKLDKESEITTVQRVAIRKMYEDLEEKGFDAVFKDIREADDGLTAAPITKSAVEQRTSGVYENIREHLILRPLNYKLHAQDLDDCVYRKVGDFALVLYHLIGNAKSTLTTSKIKRDELKEWGMADRVEEVMQEALENSMRLFPACVYSKKAQKEVDFLATDLTKEDISINSFGKKLLLLSTMKTTNGALALFYPGVVEKMMGIMGGPFVAVFMNINDVMIFDRKDRSADMFAESARSSDHMGEMLSKKKYLCDKNGIRPC